MSIFNLQSGILGRALRNASLLSLSAALFLGAVGCVPQGSGSAGTPSAASAAPASASQAAPAPGKLLVGVTQFAAHPSLDNCREGFIEGMKQSGYVEGENVTFDIQNAQTDSAQAVSIANKFVSNNAALICGIATPSAVAVATAIEGTDIPLVFNAISEPVDVGLIDRLEAPGGQVTGVSDKLPSADQVALIESLLPDAQTVGVLYCSSEASSKAQAQQFEEAAHAAGLEVMILTVASSNDIASALDTMLPKVDCIQNLLDNTIVSALPLVLEKAHGAGKPVFGSEEEQVVNGCVASEGINYFDLGVQCGLQAAKILDGAPVSDIPVEVIEQSSLTINPAAIEELGLTLPDALRQRAAHIVDTAD